MGVWVFRGVRFLLALVSIGLAFVVVAYLSTEGQVGGPEGTIWLGRARLAAGYLVPLALFVFAVWPRLWLVALLPIGVLVVVQFALDPNLGAALIAKVSG